jgi:hypothetical protein
MTAGFTPADGSANKDSGHGAKQHTDHEPLEGRPKVRSHLSTE